MSHGDVVRLLEIVKEASKNATKLAECGECIETIGIRMPEHEGCTAGEYHDEPCQVCDDYFDERQELLHEQAFETAFSIYYQQEIDRLSKEHPDVKGLELLA